MQWSEATATYIQQLKPIKTDQALILRLLSLLDYTRLTSEDTEASVATFLENAQTPLGAVAAVCVYPTFVRMAAAQMRGTPIKVATVANFPEGASPLDAVLIEINAAIEAGAQEIDVVFPYARYLAGERQYAQTFVETCKAACGDKVLLKVILETGALIDPAIIADAAYAVVAGGADFVKTSTGKIAEGATLQAAATILLVIKHVLAQTHRTIGFKVAGGLSSIEQAAHYLELADQIMGREWVRPATFRIGSSKLLDEMVQFKI